jgi:hypothetical protein
MIGVPAAIGVNYVCFVISDEAVDPTVVDVLAAVPGVPEYLPLSLLLLACLLLQITLLLKASSLLLASTLFPVYLLLLAPAACYGIDVISAVSDFLLSLASLQNYP